MQLEYDAVLTLLRSLIVYTACQHCELIIAFFIIIIFMSTLHITPQPIISHYQCRLVRQTYMLTFYILTKQTLHSFNALIISIVFIVLSLLWPPMLLQSPPS